MSTEQAKKAAQVVADRLSGYNDVALIKKLMDTAENDDPDFTIAEAIDTATGLPELIALKEAVINFLVSPRGSRTQMKSDGSTVDYEVVEFHKEDVVKLSTALKGANNGEGK